MSEKDRQAIIDAAEKLQQGIDQQLKATEYEDAEILQEFGDLHSYSSEQATKLTQAQYRQKLRSVRSNPQFVAKLKSRGLTPEAFVQLEQKNPEAYGRAYSQGEDNYLDMLQGKTGKPSDPFYSTNRMVKPPPQSVEKARKVAKQKAGDMDAVLNALMGFSDN